MEFHPDQFHAPMHDTLFQFLKNLGPQLPQASARDRLLLHLVRQIPAVQIHSECTTPSLTLQRRINVQHEQSPVQFQLYGECNMGIQN